VSIQPPDPSAAASRESFNTARRRGFIQDALAVLSGRPDDLLSFSQVTEELHLDAEYEKRGVHDIPLNQIVGSVDRYRDFNRAFLPRGHISPERWARIDRLGRQARLAPIDVFKIGDVYFVQDGNHRVSVARARGDTTIRAHVVEIPTRVPLGPDTSPDDLILKAGYQEFLEATSLDRVVPDQRIELTRPGGYRSLHQHIEIHQFHMGLRSKHYPDLAEAATDWYNHVYRPIVETIRASGILSRFPGRTEADLYLWIAENRARLQMRYGGSTKVHEAVDDFARQNWVSPFRRWLRRLRQRIFPRRRTPEPRQRTPRIRRPPNGL
jgi:hypothetical protein